MKAKLTILLLCIMSMTQAQNPFFAPFNTPHGTIPFDRIKVEHFAPAVREGISRQNQEINAITKNEETPTFANTIVPTMPCRKPPTN